MGQAHHGRLYGVHSMVAEAHDHYSGDLGNLEEVRNGLTGAHLLVTGRGLNKDSLVAWDLSITNRCKQYFHYHKHFLQLLS